MPSGWRQISEPMYDMMLELAEQYEEPVGIAVLERDDGSGKTDVYGGSFGGVPAKVYDRIDGETEPAEEGLGDVVCAQLAILAVCTAHVYGLKALKELNA